MEELVSLLTDLMKSDPMKALAVSAIILCAILFVELKRRFGHDILRFESSLDGFGKKMSFWESEIRKHMGQTGKDLLKHSEDMGKATKAINGDMLKIQENVFDLKSSIKMEVESLKENAAALHRDFLAIAQKVDLSVEALHNRFGSVIQIKKELEMQLGKIIQVEENNGKNAVRIAKHDEHFTTIGHTLESYKIAVAKLRTEMAKRGNK